MKQRFTATLTMVVMAFLLNMGMAVSAHAQSAPGPQPAPSAAGDSCTSFQERMSQMGTSTEPGMLSEIYYYIKEIIDGTTQKLYETFIDNAGYQYAVAGAITLMIIIFGVAFTIGVTQPSFGQAVIRLIRIGIIASLISPFGWYFFSDPYNGAGVVAFFNDGTDDLIKGVMGIATGTPTPDGATPFYQLDQLAEFLIHPETLVALMGMTFASGPFGLAMGGLMLFATAGFVQLMIQALRIYAVSYVARSLLLGVAPIFIIFLLFDKTRQLFMSWVNALVSLSLQPILLFTFLSFFFVLIESATTNVMSVELCWTDFSAAEGTANKFSFWRLVDPETHQPIVGDFNWDGWWECTVKGTGQCPEFPINVIDVLTFLLLIYLANRFAGVIDRIANELSNAFISLDAGGRLDQFMQDKGRGSSSAWSTRPITGNKDVPGGQR